MASKNYVTISIPKELIAEVDEIVGFRKRGYTSRAEFVKDSIRDKLKNIK